MSSSSLAYRGPVEAATDPSGVTGRLCDWLVQLRLDQASPEALERAKALILDGLGCALVGAQLPWSRTAVERVLAFEGRGDHAIIGWDATTSAPAAALLNGTFIQGFELDDFHPLGPLHSASVVLPALLAASQALGGVSGERFLLAALAGFEVGPRVGMALHGAQMLSRGWHSGAVFGTHAAAAATGVLLDLDAARFEDALGLAGTQSGGLMAAQYEAMCKRMHHGFAARGGLYAALLAAGGYTGIKRVFERDYGGFLSVFGEGHDPDASQIVDGLGARWETLRIAIKPYAAMGALHAPLDCLFDIAARRPLTPDTIASIQVDMGHAAYHHGWWEVERPLTPIGAQMNVAYALAAAILDGEAMMEQFTPERIDRDDVWRLIPRIRAVHEAAFDTSPTGRGSARVTIRFTDGSVEEQFTPMTRTISAPLPTDGVIDKFRVLTRRLMPVDRQDAIIDLVLRLETLERIDDLVALLAPEVGAAFS
jgi:2-methylcitrate dehydratase PrpD